MTVSLTSQDPARLAVDALVVAVAQQDGAAAVLAPSASQGAAAQLADAAASVITGAADEVRRLPAPASPPTVLVLTGLGAAPTRSPPRRSAARPVPRRASSRHRPRPSPSPPTTPRVAAVAEGALLGAYAFTRYRAVRGRDQAGPVAAIEIVTAHAETARDGRRRPRRGHRAAVHGTRDLVNAAPNDLYPAAFAEAAKTAAKDSGAKGLKMTVLDDKALAAGGYGGLSGVGQGSVRGPRLVKVAYSPRARRRRSRSSARASRSTPAASRSSPPTAWRP